MKTNIVIFTIAIFFLFLNNLLWIHFWDGVKYPVIETHTYVPWVTPTSTPVTVATSTPEIGSGIITVNPLYKKPQTCYKFADQKNICN
jgi:hypothetical protein